jgi:hypothetical protein
MAEKLKESSWWMKEIRKRSRSTKRIILLCLVLPFSLIAIAVYGVLTVYIPEGGNLGCFYISKDVVKFIEFLAVIFGSIGLTTIWGFFAQLKPDFLNYHRAALEIIDDLEESKKISNSVGQKMRDRIGVKLTACDSPDNRKVCEENLCELAEELSRFSYNQMFDSKLL